MPTRYTKGNELAQLQYEVGNEIKRDAAPIAQGVFGDNARHPDMASVSNSELDQIYREAYLKNDRQFLQQEAQRDPVQFLAVTDRLGVQDPPLDAQGNPTGPDPNALQKALMSPPTAPLAPPTAPPGAVPMGAVPPQAAPVAPPPPVPSAPTVQPPLPGM